MSAHPAGHLADVTPVTAEFALHGIDMIQLPRLQFRGRSAVDAADTVESQQAIMNAVRAVYALPWQAARTLYAGRLPR